MKKYALLSFLVVFSALLSCELSTPLECMNGQEKCVDSDLGTGIYYVCSEDGKWDSPTACQSACAGKTCGEFGNLRSCDNEGERRCVDSDGLALSLYCHNNRWVMTPCMGACEEGKCVSSGKGCTEGEKLCKFFDSINLSVEVECHNNQYISKSCADGVSCDGARCASAPEIKCSEPDGTSCEGKDTWSQATCTNGQCIPDKCKDTYYLSNGDCFEKSECCGKNCINCKSMEMVCSENGECIDKDACVFPNTICNEFCIDTTTSQDYCGADQNCEGYISCSETMRCKYDSDSSKYSCVCDGKTACGDACYDLSNTLEHCGDCDTDCTRLAGWNSGNCIEGKCQASECINPFTVTKVTVDGIEVSTCTSEEVVECGTTSKVNCADTIEGWVTGHCDTVDNSGEQEEICIIDSCVDGYHVYDNTCEKDDADHCGNHESTCKITDIPGSSEVACEAGACKLISCDESHSINGNSCLAKNCIDNQTQCVNDSSTAAGKIQKCTNEQWVEDSACQDGASCKSDGKSCGECTNGSTSCNNNSSKVGQLKTCNNGVWGGDSACKSSASCKDAKTCGSCKNDATQCSGTKLQKCVSGSWDSGTACPVPNNGSATCDSGKCGIKCNNGFIPSGNSCVKANCTEGATQCVNGSDNVGKMQKCEGNKWVDQSTCSGSNSCNAAGTACGECKNTSKKCTDSSNIGKVYTCTNGSWGSGSSCSTTSCNGTACGECKNTSVKCENSGNVGYTYTCSGGKWGSGTKCNNSYSCSSATACSTVCQNTTKKCTTGSDNIGKIQTCANGAWGTAANCTSNYSCKSSTACGECKNTAKKCTNNSSNIGTAYTCSNGSWGTGTGCGSTSCNGTVCGECKNTTTKCNQKSSGTADTKQTCASGAWGSANNCTTSVSNAVGACASTTDCGSFKCKSGYCESGSTCVSNQTDINNCGSCGKKCYTVTGASGVTCEGGECKMTGCLSGYYYDETYGTCLLKVKDCGEELCDINGACDYSSLCFKRSMMEVCPGTSGQIYCTNLSYCSSRDDYYYSCVYWP